MNNIIINLPLIEMKTHQVPNKHFEKNEQQRKGWCQEMVVQETSSERGEGDLEQNN